MEKETTSDEPSFIETVGVIAIVAVSCFIIGLSFAWGVDTYFDIFGDTRAVKCPSDLKLVYDSSEGGVLKCVEE